MYVVTEIGCNHYLYCRFSGPSGDETLGAYGGGAAAGPAVDPAAQYVKDEDMSTIMNMGFTNPDMVRNALIIARGHLEDALTLLLQHPEQ